MVHVGPYGQSDLVNIMNVYAIDVVCIMSIWPETFCYTMSEALQCNIPVFVMDIGAPAERLRKNQCGWIIDKNASPSECVQKLIEIAMNPKELETKKQNVELHQEKSVKQMAEEYSNHYVGSILNKERNSDFDAKYIYDAKVH